MENPTQNPEQIRSEIKGIFQEFWSLENVRDIIKIRTQEGKITSKQISILLRSVRVFEGNTINMNKDKGGDLIFKTDDELAKTINERHLKMIALTDKLWKDGEKYLSEWNKMYEWYTDTVKIKIQILKQEIENAKTDDKKRKEQAAEMWLKDLDSSFA